MTPLDSPQRAPSLSIMSDSQKKAAISAYIEKHDLKNALEEALISAIQADAPDPRAFIAEILTKGETIPGIPYLNAEARDMMRSQMAPMMHVPGVADGEQPTYEDVSAYMVPAMFNPEDKDMGPMKNPRVNWNKFQINRPYCIPGYTTKAPRVGDIAPDGPLHSLKHSGPSSTLLVEVRKLAAAAGSDKVVLGFDAMTCPFWRAYCAFDLMQACGSVPILHIYSQEAEPEDTFNAGGSQSAGKPLDIAPPIKFHHTLADRRAAALKAKSVLQKFSSRVEMWIDGMDDELEGLYESRPWRYYVLEAASGKVLENSSLAPFNVEAKCAAIRAACGE